MALEPLVLSKRTKEYPTAIRQVLLLAHCVCANNCKLQMTHQYVFSRKLSTTLMILRRIKVCCMCLDAKDGATKDFIHWLMVSSCSAFSL